MTETFHLHVCMQLKHLQRESPKKNRASVFILNVVTHISVVVSMSVYSNWTTFCLRLNINTRIKFIQLKLASKDKFTWKLHIPAINTQSCFLKPKQVDSVSSYLSCFHLIFEKKSLRAGFSDLQQVKLFPS